MQAEAAEQEERLKKLVVPQHRDAAVAAEQAAKKHKVGAAGMEQAAGAEGAALPGVACGGTAPAVGTTFMTAGDGGAAESSSSTARR